MRPLGSVFSVVFPPALSSTNPCPHRATYRVTGHDKLGDTVKCIGWEELPAPTKIPWKALQSMDAFKACQAEYEASFQQSEAP